MRKRYKIILGFLLALSLLVAFNWKILNYGIAQAKGQLQIIREAKPIEAILNDASVSDTVKYKIRLIQDVKTFAFDSLGLTESENYSTFYDQKGEVSLWNLSACEPYSFKPQKWNYPILGSFPYKGFFELEKAQREYDELEQDGYDVRIRPVSGWSTLGWTKDPILSNMLERSDGSLVELIIHELTHSTLFIEDDIQFNENLASFIGERGALKYLKLKFGSKSDELFEYILNEEDSRVFRNQMLLITRKLDSIYQSFEFNTPDSSKSISKHILIDRGITSLDTLHFHNARYYDVFSENRPNNAYFMSYLRYYSSEDSLENILEKDYHGDLKIFIEGMNNYHD